MFAQNTKIYANHSFGCALLECLTSQSLPEYPYALVNISLQMDVLVIFEKPGSN